MAKVLRIEKKIPRTWEEASANFLFWKQAEGVSERTIEDYSYHITKFYKRFPDCFTSGKLKPAVLRYMSDKIKPATFNIRLVYLKTFFSWCVRERIIDENPLEGISKRKTEGRVLDINLDLIKALIGLPDKNTFAGMRDYALFLLILDTGVRPGEAFSLRVNDINFKNLQMTIPSEVAKTRVSRTLPISPITGQVIKQLVVARHPYWTQDTPIFCTVDGGKMTRHTLYERMKLYNVKLNGSLRGYDLRHFFATQSLRNNPNVHALRVALGHSSLYMAQRYLHLVEDDIKDWHNQSSPLKSLLPQKQRVRKITVKKEE